MKLKYWIIISAIISTGAIVATLMINAHNTKMLEFQKGCDADKRQEYTEALEHYKYAADRGLPQAQYNLGILLIEGKGIEKPDTVAALALWEKAAEKDHAKSIYNLAITHYQQKEYTKAIEWFKKLTEKSYVDIPIKVAYCYNELKDYKNALEWYEKASEYDSDAKIMIADYYFEGKGVAIDSVKGLEILTSAAANKNKKAQYALGTRLLIGKGVAKDEFEAFKWLKKAASYSDLKDAQYSVALCYHNGIGTQHDLFNAEYWYVKAAQNGSKEAEEVLYKQFNYKPL